MPGTPSYSGPSFADLFAVQAQSCALCEAIIASRVKQERLDLETLDTGLLWVTAGETKGVRGSQGWAPGTVEALLEDIDDKKFYQELAAKKHYPVSQLSQRAARWAVLFMEEVEYNSGQCWKLNKMIFDIIETQQVAHRREDLARLRHDVALLLGDSSPMGYYHRELSERMLAIVQADAHLPLANQLGFDPAAWGWSNIMTSYTNEWSRDTQGKPVAFRLNVTGRAAILDEDGNVLEAHDIERTIGTQEPR